MSTGVGVTYDYYQLSHSDIDELWLLFDTFALSIGHFTLYSWLRRQPKLIGLFEHKISIIITNNIWLNSMISPFHRSEKRCDTNWMKMSKWTGIVWIRKGMSSSCTEPMLLDFIKALNVSGVRALCELNIEIFISFIRQKINISILDLASV